MTQSNKVATFFTPWQIYFASCLGTPLAATWLAVNNYRCFQQPEKIRQVLVLGVVAMMFVIVIAVIIPQSWPFWFWPFIYSFGSYFYARRAYQNHIVQFTAQGFKRKAWWRVILISFIFFFLIYVVLLAIAIAFPSLLETLGQ